MCRVLIADDEPKVLLLIRNLIEWDELGLELVATANDGVSALALIEEQRPDIVITDIRMPGHDGIELIARAKARYPAINFIIISGYRHFDYAQQAIRFGVEDYLLKPLKALEINQTLRKMSEKHRLSDQQKQRQEDDARRRNERFVALLADAARHGDDNPLAGASLEKVNSDYGLALRPGGFQAFVVKADVDSAAHNATVRRLLHDKTTTTISDALRPLCHVCVLHGDERGVHGVINFDEAQKKALRRALVGVIDALQAQGELFGRIKVSVGLGRPSTELAGIALSCREAQAAVSDRLIVGTGRIIDPASSEAAAAGNDDLVSRVFSPERRRRLLQGIEILDATAVFVVIDEIAQLAATQNDLRGEAVYALFDECCQALLFALKSQNAVDAWVDEQQRTAREQRAMCHAQRDVFALLARLATGAIEHVAALRQSESARPVRDAQKYIAAHYAQAIGLEAISQRAGFNPTYFSALFKKETGMNFIDYLTDVRVREAKRLLADPRQSIADIAEAVGYSDVKHFSRLFTRCTGIQPSKYRKLYY